MPPCCDGSQRTTTTNRRRAVNMVTASSTRWRTRTEGWWQENWCWRILSGRVNWVVARRLPVRGVRDITITRRASYRSRTRRWRKRIWQPLRNISCSWDTGNWMLDWDMSMWLRNIPRLASSRRSLVARTTTGFPTSRQHGRKASGAHNWVTASASRVRHTAC